MKPKHLFPALVLTALLHFTASAKDWLAFEGKEGIGSGQHIVFVTGEEFYRSEEGMPMFAKILSQRFGYDCTVLFSLDPELGTINPNINHNIPGLHLLKDADLLFIFARFRELPDKDMKHIADYINAGKPVIGIRNATHAFRYTKNKDSAYVSWDWKSQSWPGGFGQQILGDTWVKHYGKFQKEATRARTTEVQRSHPVLQGVSPEFFIHTDVNSVLRLKPQNTVLLTGQVLSGPNPDSPPVTDERKYTRMPLAWFKEYTAPSGKTGQTFCTTAGASVDWLSEDLRRVLVNAVFQLTGHSDKIPCKTNVDFIGEYKPGPFRNYTNEEWAKKALKPADFGLSTQ